MWLSIFSDNHQSSLFFCSRFHKLIFYVFAKPQSLIPSESKIERGRNKNMNKRIINVRVLEDNYAAFKNEF